MAPRASFVILLLPVLVLLAGCSRPGPRLGFEARSGYEQLVVTVEALPDTVTHLVWGEPWTGRDPIHPMAPGARFRWKPRGGKRPYRVLVAARLPAGAPIEQAFPVNDVPEGAGVLQLVATRGERLEAEPFVASSRAFLVRRSDRGLSVRPLGDVMLERHGLRAGLYVLAFLAFLVVLHRLPFPRGGALRCLRIAGAGVVLALLLLRGSSGEATQAAVDAGLAPAPLLWPGDWELRGDGWERFLGPGYVTLEERAARERAARDLPLFVRWENARGPYQRRAACLLRRLVGVTPLVGAPAAGPGLVLSFGLPAQGRVLLRTEAGSLSLVGKEEGR